MLPGSPAQFHHGRGGWEHGCRFLKRQRLFAFALGRWGIWNGVRHFQNTCCTQAKVSETAELLGTWRCGFSRSFCGCVDLTLPTASGSADWTRAPRPQRALLDIRSGLTTSTGLWTAGVRIPPSWSRACSADEEQPAVLNRVHQRASSKDRGALRAYRVQSPPAHLGLRPGGGCYWMLLMMKDRDASEP